MRHILHDHLVDAMRRRTEPACVTCLTHALRVQFNDLMLASQDADVRRAFGRSNGACPECAGSGVVLHPTAEAPPSAMKRLARQLFERCRVSRETAEGMALEAERIKEIVRQARRKRYT